jgi:peroxiredoxin
MRRVLVCTALAVLAASACRSDPRPALALGAAAPDFALAGTDGATHRLSEYAASPVLAVVFTCNHCPASQQNESRLQKLHADYRGKGVALVAISPDSPAALRASDLAFSDSSDSLDDMKQRAGWRRLTYPYLYDGDAQAVSKAFGPVALPHVFVFDRERKLRYEGRVDDAQAAIDALLAGQTVRTEHTRVTGCAPAWKSSAPAQSQDATSAPTLEMASADVLKKLRANDTGGKLLLVNFWATWCGPCAVEFPDLVMTHDMYRGRGFEFVSVSENEPGEKDLVIDFLRRKQAFANRNLLFATPQTYDMQAAFDPAMPAAVPFTLLIAPNGDVMYQETGSLDVLKMRRAILANLPDDKDHPGMRAYWGT